MDNKVRELIALEQKRQNDGIEAIISLTSLLA